MTLRGKPVEPSKTYKVAGWAPVSEEAKAAGGEPIWDVMARYLKAQKTIKPLDVEPAQGRGHGGKSGDGLTGGIRFNSAPESLSIRRPFVRLDRVDVRVTAPMSAPIPMTGDDPCDSFR